MERVVRVIPLFCYEDLMEFVNGCRSAFGCQFKNGSVKGLERRAFFIMMDGSVQWSMVERGEGRFGYDEGFEGD